MFSSDLLQKDICIDQERGGDMKAADKWVSGRNHEERRRSVTVALIPLGGNQHAVAACTAGNNLMYRDYCFIKVGIGTEPSISPVP